MQRMHMQYGPLALQFAIPAYALLLSNSQQYKCIP